MTAASGDPGDKPDYQGHPPSGYGIPTADPAYGGWQPTPAQPPAADYPPYPDYPPFPVYPPQYGTPGYPGYPAYPGYPVPAQPGTNVLAIISLVASASGVLCFIGSLLGIVAGAIAIYQVKRTGQSGFGVAVAGTAAGVAGLVLYVAMVAYAPR